MRPSLRAIFLVMTAGWLAAGCNDTNSTIQGNTGAVISFLAPSNTTAGGPDFTLTVNGSGFTSSTVVQWNSQNRTTTFVSSLQLTATITAADIAKPGSVTVNTFTPQKGQGLNGLSNTLVFQIQPPPNPVPTITSISPSSAPAGSPSFTLTISGSNFLAGSGGAGGSIVQWNAGPQQTNLQPSSITTSQISVTIPASLVAAPGTAIVTVFNPAPGGGTSPNGQTFTITGPVAPPAALSDAPSLSADGRFVAFTAADGGRAQVFVRDTCEGAPAGCKPGTSRVSIAADGGATDGDSRAPSISADGRFVAFESSATNLVAAGASGRQIFLRDTCAGAAGDCAPSTALISTDPDGKLAGNENLSPAISASGRFVAFVSMTPARAANSAPGRKNSGFQQVFVRDTCRGAANCAPRTIRISLHNGDDASEAGRVRPALSRDGRRIAVPAPAANLFTRSTPVEDRVFLSLSEPGK